MAEETAKIVAIETTVSITESIDYKSGKTGISMLTLMKKYPGDVSTDVTIKEAEEVWKGLISEGKVLGQEATEPEEDEDKEAEAEASETPATAEKEAVKPEEDEEDEEDEDEDKEVEKPKQKPYTEMTIEELRALCKERKIEKTKRGTPIEEANVGKLVIALELYDDSQENK